eukprot:gene13445-15847_t
MSNIVANSTGTKRRWAIDLSSEKQLVDAKTNLTVKPPIPMASTASSSSVQQTNNNVDELKSRKGWELAKSPAKNIMMTGFFLWMIGGGINIFTMPVIIYSVINPIKAIIQTNNVFIRFNDLKGEATRMKITYAVLQLALLGVALYKCSSMESIRSASSPFSTISTASSQSSVFASAYGSNNRTFLITKDHSSSLGSINQVVHYSNTNTNSTNNNSNNNEENNTNEEKEKVSTKKFGIFKALLLVTGATFVASYVFFKVNGQDVKLEYIKRIPFRFTSNLWGKVANIEVPESARELVYGSYAKAFGVKLDEMEKPLLEYPSLAAFFSRRLKPSARPIDQDCAMISPVDGRVIYCGPVTDGSLEQVKGLKYSVADFLGDQEMEKIKDKNLFHVGIYLSPGDYHGIHSPVEWSIQQRYHFPGYLFPVAKVAVDNIPGLFAMNERVVLAGKWKHGYFSLTPVGASNVGSIVMDFDKDLFTNNQNDKYKDKQTYYHRSFQSSPVPSKRGEEVAFFKMGSTVILIFEVPKGQQFDFNLVPGQALQLGEPIGKLVKN